MPLVEQEPIFSWSRIAALKRHGLRIINRVIGRLPYCFRLLGVQAGLAEFGSFTNTIVYPPQALPRPCFKTVRKRSPPTIILSSASRCLKGGGLISMVGGIARRNGAVYTSSGELVVSRNNVYEFVPSRLLATPPTLFPRIKVADEPVAVLSTLEFNYFHWMHDVLPKIHLLATAGREDVKLYVNIVNDVQRETLRLLGIQSERIINSADHEFIAASELVIPNSVGRAGACRILESQWRANGQEIVMGNISGFVGVAVWTCRFLRDSFLDVVANGTPKGSRIYVSRRDATKRRQTKIEEAFGEEIRGHGFKTIVLAGMKFVDQVDIFRNADVVLAPHGAGLANIAFCKPGTKLVELFPTYVSDLYAVLSQVVGTQYYYLMGTRQRHWKYRRSNELEFDPGELDELFELAGLESILG